jgi:predicted O-methyltransferase YrrM
MKPIPHFFEGIGENWFSYAGFYADIVKQMPDSAVMVEIGSWKGRSTACLGVEIINSGKGICLICVDAWKYVPSTEQPVSSQAKFDKVYNEFVENTRLFENFLSIVRKDSVQAAGYFRDNSIDFVFIDALHTYEGVKADAEAWLPKVRPGGIIAGHDSFTRVHPGVKKAVDELFPNVNLIPDQNVWWIKK